MKKEIRHIDSRISFRATDGEEDSRYIEGYALLFDTRSQDLGGFVETIAPGALDGVLERSDVLALLNHDMARGVLARSRKGQGSLTLEVDSKGLLYRFEAPNTALGDELLEGVRRGDISQSSFAFTVEDEKWDKEEDGRYVRTILRFSELFDVSPVYHPAYLETSVDTRGLDAFKAARAEEEDDPKDDPDAKEPADDTPDDDKDPQEEEPQDKDSCDEGDDKKDDRNNDNNNNLINTTTKMKKEKFSLLGAIRAVAENRTLDGVAAQVVAEGRKGADSVAGVNASGQIQLPLEYDSEKRFEDTPSGILASQNDEAATYGGEAVPTELFDILGPLQERMVLTQLGARMLNLTSNVELAAYSGATVTWENEIAKAKDGSGKFSKIKLQPKRITAKIPISKQFLLQTSPSAEAMIRQDLIDAVALKLQQTIFGAAKGTDTMPQGLLYGVSAESAAVTFADVVQWEAALEEAKILGEKKYVLSPSAKAILRTTKVDEGSGRMVMENGEVAGVPALSTGSVQQKGLIVGDWSQLVIGSFGALDLTVDPYKLADSAQILLVVNAWFDYAVTRPEAFVKKILQ